MKQKPINKYSQKLGYITKKIIFLSFFLSFIACSKKVEDKMLDNTTEMTNARIGEEVETVEKNEENIFQLSPVRDLERLDPALVKEYVSSVIAQEQIIDEPSDEFVIPCGGINPAPSTMRDLYANRIKAIAQYGTDPRELYYIQYNTITNQPNKPIVVLVHGGAWYSGPNPNTTNGWYFGWTSTNVFNTNIVKQLLANGYIVITMLYPLIGYGKDNAEIIGNTTTIQTQMNSIDEAINHIRTNFKPCLGLNANSIQLVGESAGGHLVLNWAYNNANTSYIKSVISMYAPTNMQQYGEYIRVKPFTFNCGGAYWREPNPSPPFTVHFPWYFYLDLATQSFIFNTISPPICSISNSLPPPIINPRILDLYNDIQSSYAQVITAPLSNSTLLTYSPYHALNTSHIIPTFIMHGDNDNLVPYTNATNGMATSLTNIGDLVFNYTNSGTGTNVPTTYNNIKKHGIKIYKGGDHGFVNGPLTLIRGDIIKWLNGHK